METHIKSLRIFSAIISLLFLCSCGKFKSEIETTASPDKIFYDVPYKIIDGKEIKLDIYLPEIKIHEKTPVIIYVHGGAWLRGHKEMMLRNKFGELFDLLINNGVAIVAIDYRLLKGKSTFPDPIEDVRDATEWVSANADQYQLDGNRIGLWGASAGAHLSLLSAYTDDCTQITEPERCSVDQSTINELPGEESTPKINMVLAYFPPTNLSNLIHPEFSVADDIDELGFIKSIIAKRAAIFFYGLDLVDDFERYQTATARYSPINYIRNGIPPTAIFHGDNDETVNIAQSITLIKLAKKINAPITLSVMPNIGHALKHSTEDDREILAQKAYGFIREYL